MGELMLRVNRSRRCFILLEVMVAILIVGVAMVALMRGFILSLDSMKKIQMNEKAIFLAESMLDDLILEPPAEGSFSGYFTDDIRYSEDFDGWMWELDVEAEEPDYEERPQGTLPQDLEEMYIAHLKISYEDRWGERRRDNEVRTYIDVQTIIMEPDIFSPTSLQENQLF
jgi:type II secretory pathway pseudopilin PulG